MPNAQIGQIELNGKYYVLTLPSDANLSIGVIDFHNVIEVNGTDLYSSLAPLNHVHFDPTHEATYGNTLYIEDDNLYMTFHRADAETYYPYLDFTDDKSAKYQSDSLFRIYLPNNQVDGTTWNLKRGTKLKFTGDYNYLNSYLYLLMETGEIRVIEPSDIQAEYEGVRGFYFDGSSAYENMYIENVSWSSNDGYTVTQAKEQAFYAPMFYYRISTWTGHGVDICDTWNDYNHSGSSYWSANNFWYFIQEDISINIYMG